MLFSNASCSISTEITDQHLYSILDISMLHLHARSANDLQIIFCYPYEVMVCYVCMLFLLRISFASAFRSLHNVCCFQNQNFVIRCNEIELLCVCSEFVFSLFLFTKEKIVVCKKCECLKQWDLQLCRLRVLVCMPCCFEYLYRRHTCTVEIEIFQWHMQLPTYHTSIHFRFL